MKESQALSLVSSLRVKTDGFLDRNFRRVYIYRDWPATPVWAFDPEKKHGPVAGTRGRAGAEKRHGVGGPALGVVNS